MHEQNASHMADGFYRASGKIAGVVTSIGPGATNTLTGIATAFADSLPQLVITGGVHTYMMGRGVLQELDRPHSDNFPADGRARRETLVQSEPRRAGALT